MNCIQIKNTALAVLAAAGGAAAQALGGWDMALQVLVSFMAADYLTGLLVAGVFKRSLKTPGGAISSRAGFLGLLRKCAVLLVVLLAVPLDRAAGSSFIRTAVCLFFLATAGLSILENLGLLGGPSPAFRGDRVEARRKPGDEGGRGQ